MRDIEERGRDLETVLLQYTSLVKPAFEEFCIPTKKYADVIIPRGAENTVAIDLIKQHIQDLIFRSAGGNRKESNCHERSRSNSDSTNTSRWTPRSCFVSNYLSEDKDKESSINSKFLTTCSPVPLSVLFQIENFNVKHPGLSFTNRKKCTFLLLLFMHNFFYKGMM